MELVDEIFQIVRDAEAAGGGKIAGALIAPGGVQGVLGDGEQLHMGEAQLLYIGHQIGGDVPIGEELPLAGAAPGAQMALVDVHGAAVGRVLGPVLQPGLVVPLVAGAVQIVDFGGDIGAGLGVEGIGIRLADVAAVLGMDGVLIGVVAL